MVIAGLIFGAALGGFIFFMARSRKPETQEEIVKLSERMETANKIWSEQFKEVRNEIGKARREELELRDRSNKDIHHQMEKFITGIVQMKDVLNQVQGEVKEVSSFQNIFKSPKLTGQWGEASLDYMLSQYFPRRDAYQLQYQFSSGEAVDAILKLPNGRILPIDSKFPQDNFNQFIGAATPEAKEETRKNLIARIKKDVDDISSKYILPNENTVDFAMMYIPAESLYYEVVTREDLATYAWNKKVILASPNTFILTVGVIQHWFKDADIGKRTGEILKKLQRVAIDGEKLDDSFRKLGSHLSNAQGAYSDSEKRLGLLVERVSNVGNLIGEEDGAKELN